MIKNWIQNIVGFLLLMSLVSQLVPEEKYRKYVRLTMGIMLIVVLVMPVVEIFGMDVSLFQNLIRSQREMGAFDAKLSEATWDMQHTFTSTYEEMIFEEVEAYFKEESVELRNCQLEIETDVNAKDYGKIYKMHVVVGLKGAETGKNSKIKRIEVESIRLDKASNTLESVIPVPEEKVIEWKKDLTLQFGLADNQLILEIVS